MLEGELSKLMRPPSSSDTKGGASTSSSSSSLPLHMAGSIYGVTVRRARRRTAMLLSSIKGAVMPPAKPHEPMTSWGSFLFLSNLIMGPGILGLPAAYRHSGVLAATSWTVGFAAASVLACVFIAHATRIYRAEARGRAAPLRLSPQAQLQRLTRPARRAEAADHAPARCDGAHAGPPAAPGDGCAPFAAERASLASFSPPVPSPRGVSPLRRRWARVPSAFCPALARRCRLAGRHARPARLPARISAPWAHSARACPA